MNEAELFHAYGMAGEGPTERADPPRVKPLSRLCRKCKVVWLSPGSRYARCRGCRGETDGPLTAERLGMVGRLPWRGTVEHAEAAGADRLAQEVT